MTDRSRVVLAHKTEAAGVALHSLLTSYGYDVLMVCDGLEAWQAVRAEDRPCIAVLDWTLPTLDGIDVCRRLRGGDHCNYVYTLLLTERRPFDEISRAMDAGADDYLLKPLQTQELRARMRVGGRILRLQERLMQARAEIYEQTTRDSLTGMWNRTAAIEILVNELARGNRTGAPLAVIMADFDHLKRFNAERGHQAGDAILRMAAQRMGETLRKYDSIGRYGGEEFLIVLPNCPYEASLAVAERLRHHVSGRSYALDDGTYAMSCSFGVAWTADCGVGAMELLRWADGALGEAKLRGRDRVEAAQIEPLLAAAVGG